MRGGIMADIIENAKNRDKYNKEYAKKNTISDATILTPKSYISIDEKATNSSVSNSNTPKKNNKNLYIYGGVGLAVILGAFLIFKKK